jgi:hypothetical protein
MEKNYINSYDRDKFEVGKHYWTYFMETTNKGDQIRNHTGVFEAKLIEMSKYGPKFEVIGGKHYVRSHKAQITTYMQGYGSANCDFYETEEEAIEGHDDKIKYYAKYLDAAFKNRMYKKLIESSVPEASVEEIEAKKWYDNLTREEQFHIKWFKLNDINYI